jgi:feruloyl esterase
VAFSFTENNMETRQTGRAAHAAALALPLVLAACGGGGDDGGTATAAQACERMAAQALPNTRITQATLVEAETTRPPNLTTGPFLPQHCVVQGLVNERTGVDGRPYAIGFQLRLPTDWNGRFFY